MTRKTKPPLDGSEKPDNPEQFRRFVETAREIGAESGNTQAFDRLLEKVARTPRIQSQRRKRADPESQKIATDTPACR